MNQCVIMWTRERLGHYQGSLYYRLSQLIEGYIEKGLLTVGERLPSERDLAKRLMIDRSTVVHALELLSDRGVVVRRVGCGTFINDQKLHILSSPLIHLRRPQTLREKPSLYHEKCNRIRLHAKRQGQLICDLANGDLPPTSLPKVSLTDISATQLMTYEQSNYENISGLHSLKIQIQKYMQREFALNVSSDHILITSGTQQSLFLLAQGLLKPGDAIGIETPSYFYALRLFQASGLRMVPIPCDEGGVKLDALEEQHKKHRLRFVFVNPVFQNPTGRVMSLERKKALLQYAHLHGMGIVEDDAYSALYFSNKVERQPLKKLDIADQVIYLGSLSKYLGRHVRVGWLVAPPEIVQSLAHIRHSIDSGLSILPQLMAERYLSTEAISHQQQLRQFFLLKRDQLHQWLSEHYTNEFHYVLPQGGYHLYAHLKGGAKRKQQLITAWLLQNRVVRLGSDFGAPEGYLRLSYGHFSEI